MSDELPAASYGTGIEPGRFFLPGPVEVHPDVLAAQAHPPIGHRGAELQTLMECLQAGLKQVFRTERPVFVSTSSATGLMEAAIRNASRTKVLSLVNGAFAERFAEMAEACGREVVRLEVPWGEPIDPQAVRDALRRGSFDAVTAVHSETSTAVLNPVREIAEVVREFDDVLLLLDSVTGVGGAELQTDAWGIDFALTGSHKALAMPPGLAFGVASERLMERAPTIPGRGHYFDLVGFEENIQKLQTPTTPAVTLLYAAAEQLARIAHETMEVRWARHLESSRITIEWIEELAGRGVEARVFAAEGARSPTVTCIDLGREDAGPRVVKAVRERGFVIGGGYGKLKSRCFRIGHMGDHPADALPTLLDHLTEVLT